MERCYGIIALRRRQAMWETLLVKHGRGHWAFPKGHSDQGDSAKATACREPLEETMLQVTCFFPLAPLSEVYTFKWEDIFVEKIVTYFLAEVEGSVQIQAEEIEMHQWVSLKAAKKLAT